MMSRMSATEYRLWRYRHFHHQPVGDWRSDARVLRLIANGINLLRRIAKGGHLSDDEVVSFMDWDFNPVFIRKETGTPAPAPVPAQSDTYIQNVFKGLAKRWAK